MDNNHFDTIARALGAAGSRRATLRALVAGALAAGLTGQGLLRVAAGCKKLGQKCEKRKDCCSGLQCNGGKCACARGGQKCDKSCCARNETCVSGGQEPPTCCAPIQVCGKNCCPPDRVCVCLKPPPFDPPPDPDDLCRCICADGYEEDSDGNCVCPFPCGDDCCEKEDGEACCSVDGGKLCVLTNSSKNHCGKCGHACPRDRVCVGGQCVCTPDHLTCGDACVPKRYPNGSPGCCSNADCTSGGFCCTAQTAFTCDPNAACGPLNHCLACL